MTLRLTLRRPFVAVVLSVLAGLFIHAASFGTEHLAGGAHASALLGTVVAALGLLALAAALGTATEEARSTRRASRLAEVLTTGLGGVAA